MSEPKIYREFIPTPTQAEATQQCMGQTKPVAIQNCIKEKTSTPPQTRYYTLETVTPQAACHSYVGKEAMICLNRITKPYQQRVYVEQALPPIVRSQQTYNRCIFDTYRRHVANPVQCEKFKPQG